MSRPMWNRAQDPGQLLRYVEAGVVVALLPTVPPRGDGTGVGVLARVEALYDAFAGAGIRYAVEPVDSGGGWQRIREPEQVLRSGRLATCVDLAVSFAGGCLDVGAHPLLVVLDPEAGGPAHAIVVVWLGDSWPGTGGAAEYREFQPDTTTSPVVWPGELRDDADGRGAFLPVDVTKLTSGASFAEAVRAGAALLGSASWHASITLDVGRNYAKQGEFVSAPRRSGKIRTHTEEVTSLDGLRRNLLDSELPFVPPTDPHAVTAPRKLLDRLEEDAGLPGILLIGAAGVGKTRTCFEVAAQAVRDGWAVMHVSDSNAAVTSADVHNAILAERADRVLVVLDYINYYYEHLGLTALKDEVGEFARRNTKVAFIAACRPGWHSTTRAELDQIFEMVELVPDEAQTSVVRDRILTRVAPNATAEVKLPKMRRVCGDRPVIAMLIASEIERLHGLGELDKALQGIRPAKLLVWLKRRLAEDRLLPKPPDDPLDEEESEPSKALQACLSMLLATPQPEPAVLASGQTLANAPRLVAKLKAMGWVVNSPVGLVPAHDLVTDQLVDEILLEPLGTVVRTAVADRVLDASLSAGATVGRFAMNLSRILRDMPAAKGDALDAHCVAWLDSRADRVGEVMASGDDGAYAIGSVLDSPSWAAVVFRRWGEIVDPWLTGHPQSLSSRHLLYKGLRSEIGKTDERLVAESLVWLDVHHGTLEAQFVITGLLYCELADDVLRRTLDHAQSWLRTYGTMLGAKYLIARLLGCELDRADAHAVVGFAVRFLKSRWNAHEVHTVLARLYLREMDDDEAAAAFDVAVKWLGTHGADRAAQQPLTNIAWSRLSEDAVPVVVGFTRKWLVRHDTDLRAQYLLSALLVQQLDDDVEQLAVHGLNWLEKHGELGEACFVLSRLLPRDLSAGVVGEVAAFALTWLGIHRHSAEAQHVLQALLFREIEPDVAEAVAGFALAWLKGHEDALEAHQVLHGLLQKELAGEVAGRTIAFALTWLKTQRTAFDARQVLRSLLFHEREPDVAEAVAGHALAWLEVHGRTVEAHWVVQAFLTPEFQASLPAGVAADVLRQAVGRALGWLEDHGTVTVAEYVLSRLLPLKLDAATRELVVRLSLEWIGVNGAGSNLVSKYVSRQNELTVPVAEKFVEWASDHTDHEDVWWRLTPVAKGLNHWPHLAVPLLDVMERVMWGLSPDPVDLNQQSEVDGLLRYLCKASSLSNGTVSARMDDLLLTWLCREESLSPNCSVDSHFLELVSRATSLFVVPRRVQSVHVSILDRLHAWIGRWRWSGPERDMAWTYVAHAKGLFLS
ncbi:hypothetical protein ACFWNN_16600 [Lentzea sp. NPDC058450]|uniref:hypothetical protein n=1 Tax=Lentzea sp. NPDC058450 TaxID=3346505 RepID=UPI00365000BC